MTTWTIKSQTDDPDLALDIFDDLRYKGYSAWIEDENGRVDEKLLERTKPIRRTLWERATGPLVVLASVIVGLVIVYLLDFWIDR